MMFESAAKAQQETVDDAYRLLGTRNHGVGCFPTFLLLCLERRVWESEREDASGKPVPPCSFHAFIHAPYPDGLASSYAAIEEIIANEPKLVALWKEASGRTIDNAPLAIPVTSIRTDGGTQSRAAIDESVVTDYQDHLEKLPPIVVFYDGADYWLADGFHRLEAHKRAGRDRIIAEARQGTRRDAVLFSVGANAAHGLRRTNADKRRAVEMLLGDEEWAKKSDRWIATKCGVGHQLVASIRNQLDESSSCQSEEGARPVAAPTRIGQDGKTRKLPESRPLKTAEPPQREPAEALPAACPSPAPPQPPSAPHNEQDSPFPAEPPQPLEEPPPRMRQMTIEDRICASSVVPEAQPEPPPEPALAQVHHLEGLLFNAAWRAVQRLSNAEWAALIRRESERRSTLDGEVDP